MQALLCSPLPVTKTIGPNYFQPCTLIYLNSLYILISFKWVLSFEFVSLRFCMAYLLLNGLCKAPWIAFVHEMCYTNKLALVCVPFRFVSTTLRLHVRHYWRQTRCLGIKTALIQVLRKTKRVTDWSDIHLSRFLINTFGRREQWRLSLISPIEDSCEHSLTDVEGDSFQSSQSDSRLLLILWRW